MSNCKCENCNCKKNVVWGRNAQTPETKTVWPVDPTDTVSHDFNKSHPIPRSNNQWGR